MLLQQTSPPTPNQCLSSPTWKLLRHIIIILNLCSGLAAGGHKYCWHFIQTVWKSSTYQIIRRHNAHLSTRFSIMLTEWLKSNGTSTQEDHTAPLSILMLLFQMSLKNPSKWVPRSHMVWWIEFYWAERWQNLLTHIVLLGFNVLNATVVQQVALFVASRINVPKCYIRIIPTSQTCLRNIDDDNNTLQVGTWQQLLRILFHLSTNSPVCSLLRGRQQQTHSFIPQACYTMCLIFPMSK